MGPNGCCGGAFAEVVDSAEEAARLDGLGLSSLDSGAPGRVWVRIRPSTVTGRRIAAAPPAPE